MAEVDIRDPIIKLFGKTISLPLNHLDLPSDSKFPSSETTEKVDLFCQNWICVSFFFKYVF